MVFKVFNSIFADVNILSLKCLMTTKEQIVEGALSLFKRMGIRGVTMDMLAVHLGMSKRTIYENFENKDQIVEACVQLQNKNRQALADQITSASTHYLETYILFMWAHINQLRTINPIFIFDLKRLYPKTICKEANEFDNLIQDKMLKFIELGKNDGIFRQEVNSRIVSNIVLEIFKLLYKTDNETPFLANLPFTEVFEHISITFIRGLATTKGIEMIDYYYNKHKPIV